MRGSVRCFSVSAALLLLVAGCRNDAGRTRAAVGTARQLLFDDSLVDSKVGFALTVNPLVRTGGPALHPETAWERGCTSASVVEAGGSYKMWYTATDEKGVPRLCYAVSTNAADWTRPEVGLFDYQGSKRNNIVSLQDGNVFVDPSAPPERRFKRIGTGGKFQYRSVYAGGARFRYDRNPPATWHYAGVAGAYSPDGIHWTACRDETIMPW
jgi:hypothetical protein